MEAFADFQAGRLGSIPASYVPHGAVTGETAPVGAHNGHLGPWGGVMSNLDTRPAAQQLGGLEATSAGPALELLPGKEVLLGESTRVRRLLPTLGRRMVGAWAFVDHYGPDDVATGAGMQVAPHPHTGLQTVSWLLEGRVHHRDSLGSDVEFGPGELALMTAGHGIAHAEQSPVGHPAVPARRPAVGGAPGREPGDSTGLRAPRNAARVSAPTA